MIALVDLELRANRTPAAGTIAEASSQFLLVIFAIFLAPFRLYRYGF
jgi:hypothetical protein